MKQQSNNKLFFALFTLNNDNDNIFRDFLNRLIIEFD